MQRVWLPGTKMALKTPVCCVHNCSADQILIQEPAKGSPALRLNGPAKRPNYGGGLLLAGPERGEEAQVQTGQSDNWEHDARAS